MVLAVVVVVVAVVVVAIPIVVDAVHDHHPLLFDPFPRTERAGMPQRNGRSRPVARMVRDVAAGDMVRRRMVARLLTEVVMPCDGRLLDMMGWGRMLHPTWLGYGSRALRSPRLLGRSCRGNPHLLGSSCRASVAAVVSAFRRSECRCAECRAGKSDECDFDEVVVHSTPSLSVSDLTGSSSRPYIKQGVRVTRF